MSVTINLTRVLDAVTMLELIPHESRLLAMQNLCINNGGRWDYTADLPQVHQPCLFEIQLFGVPAMADNRDDLVRNWLLAANNILEAAGHRPSLPRGDAA